jgi:hypothetical protein
MTCKENCYSRANEEFLGAGYQAGAAVPYNATLQTGIGCVRYLDWQPQLQRG